MSVPNNVAALAKDLLNTCKTETKDKCSDMRQYYGRFMTSLDMLSQGKITPSSKETLLGGLGRFNWSKDKQLKLKEPLQAMDGGRRRRRNTRRNRRNSRRTRRN